MKTFQFHTTLLHLLLVPLSVAAAQPPGETPAPAEKVQFEVQSRRSIALADGSGRRLILERVKPPLVPEPPPIPSVAPVDPVLRAARRAASLLEAKKEHCLVSLTGIAYPNGQTYLTWSMPVGPAKEWQSFAAWSLTDFRAAWAHSRI